MKNSFASDPEQSYNTEKLELIQLLLNTENPLIIKKIKEILTNNQPEILTQQDLLNRANESEIAYKNGKIRTIDELEDESRSW